MTCTCPMGTHRSTCPLNNANALETRIAALEKALALACDVADIAIGRVADDVHAEALGEKIVACRALLPATGKGDYTSVPNEGVEQHALSASTALDQARIDAETAMSPGSFARAFAEAYARGRVDGIEAEKKAGVVVYESREEWAKKAEDFHEALEMIAKVGCMQSSDEPEVFCKHDGSAHSIYCPKGIAEKALRG